MRYAHLNGPGCPLRRGSITASCWALHNSWPSIEYRLSSRNSRQNSCQAARQKRDFTRADKIRIQKWYTVYKDHITLEDYEIHDGMGLELYYN